MIVEYKDWKIDLAVSIRQLKELQNLMAEKDKTLVLDKQLEIYNKNKIEGPEINEDSFTDEDLAALGKLKEEHSKSFLGNK